MELTLTSRPDVRLVVDEKQTGAQTTGDWREEKDARKIKLPTNSRNDKKKPETQRNVAVDGSESDNVSNNPPSRRVRLDARLSITRGRRYSSFGLGKRDGAAI